MPRHAGLLRPSPQRNEPMPNRDVDGDAPVRTVTNALDRLADGHRVTLPEIARESGLASHLRQLNSLAPGCPDTGDPPLK